MTLVTRSQLMEQLDSVGVKTGVVLVVHTSFRRVGPVENGPDGCTGV